MLWRIITLFPRLFIQEVKYVHSDDPELSPFKNFLVNMITLGVIIVVALVLLSF